MSKFLKILEGICRKDRDENSLSKLSNDSTRERIDIYLKKRYEGVLHKYIIKNYPDSSYVKEEREMINRFCYEAIIDNNPWIMNYILLDRRIVTWYYEENNFNEMICNILRCTFSSSFISILCEYEKGRQISLRSREMRIKNLHKVYYVPLGDVEYTNPLLEAIKGKNNWAIEYLYCNKNYWNGFMDKDIELIYRKYLDRELGISSGELLKMTKNLKALKRIDGELKSEFVKSILVNHDESSMKILFESVGDDKIIEKCFIEYVDIDKVEDKNFRNEIEKILIKEKLEKEFREKEGSEGKGRIKI